MITKLREMRKSRKLTQLELARRSGVSQQTISNIEMLVRPDPQVSTAIKLSRALHCLVEDLIEEEAQ